MRYNFRFLVRVGFDETTAEWRAVCPSADVAAKGASKLETLASIEEALRTFVDQRGVDYVFAAGGNNSHLRCPNGTINFIADDWFCKETERRCPIGAIVSRADVDESLRKCDASATAKDMIRGAIRAGYAGLHHISANYLCVGCGDHGRYKPTAYHYHFELQTLDALVDVSSPEATLVVRRRLIENRMNPAALYCGLCADCQRIVTAVEPATAKEIHVIPIDLTIENRP